MSQYVVWWSAGDWWILFLTVLLSTSLLFLCFLTVSIHASRISITLSLVSMLWNSRGLTFFSTLGTLSKLQWLAVIWVPEVNFSKNETLHTVSYVQLQREIWLHESTVFAVVASTLGTLVNLYHEFAQSFGMAKRNALSTVVFSVKFALRI